jgi:cobalt-zinc-cadmium efflux system outer membrane protein
MMAAHRILFLWLVLLAGGCAHYQQQPIEPAKLENDFRARTLGEQRPSWDLESLTRVALRLHPDMEVARARVATAAAGLKTAGERPNPTVSWATGYTTSPESPWLYGGNFDIPIETAGKRGDRLKQAEALTDAAHFDLAATAWSVRSRLRRAFLGYLLAGRQVELLRAEEAARAEVVTVLEQQLALGQVSRPEVDAVRIELANTRQTLRAAEGQVDQSRTVLAGAIGVPVAALAGVRLDWPQLDEPPAPPVTLQRTGLLNRLDLQRALAEYAAAEAALQLEIAKQYPDIHLSPSYAFDDGQNKYELGVTITLPILNQNQGPIAEAEARRRQLAAQFLALQAQLIGETEQASSRYRMARSELNEATTVVAESAQREKTLQLSVKIGEADAAALAAARVQIAVAARARLDALQKAQAALGALEDAVQRPLE